MRSSLVLMLAAATLTLLVLPATGVGNPASGGTDQIGDHDDDPADDDTGRYSAGSYAPPPAPGTAGSEDPAPAFSAASRVGRISFVEGEVSWFVEPMASKAWLRAELNLPILSRSSLSTARGARAEVRIGAMTVLLHGDSQADFVEVAYDSLLIRVSRGTVALSAPSFEPRDSITMRAAGVELLVRAAGSYVLGDLPDSDDAVAGVIEGQAEVRASTAASPLIAGQQVRVGNNGSLSYGHYDLLGGDLDRWVRERSGHWRSVASSQYVSSAEVTGADVLQDFGQWEQEQSLGAIWYPSVVDASWAPYQDGRWISVEPLGRVWVSAAPWVFATSHYGRWHRVNHRWGWVPGTHRRGHHGGHARGPVFSPPPAGARPPPPAFPPALQPVPPPPLSTPWPAPAPYPTPPRNYPNPPRAYPTPPRDYPTPARRLPAPGQAAGIVPRVPSPGFGPQTPQVFRPPVFVAPSQPAGPRMVTKPRGSTAGTW